MESIITVTKRIKKTILIPTCILVALLVYVLQKKSISNIDMNEINQFSNTSIDPGFRIVTFFSKNHFNESIRGCKSFMDLNETTNWKKGVFIVYYHIDVTHENLKDYSTECPIAELRFFDLRKYPPHVRILRHYSFKPIVFNEVLMENVTKLFWFDASIVFNDQERFQKILDEQIEFPCGIRELHKSQHSVYSATNPVMLKRFNMSVEQAAVLPMFGSGAFFYEKTPKSKAIIRTWYLCGMEDGCMSPVGSVHPCDEEKVQKGEYGGCHRYDQSILSILLFNCIPETDKIFRHSDMILVSRINS